MRSRHSRERAGEAPWSALGHGDQGVRANGRARTAWGCAPASATRMGTHGGEGAGIPHRSRGRSPTPRDPARHERGDHGHVSHPLPAEGVSPNAALDSHVPRARRGTVQEYSPIAKNFEVVE